MTTPPERPEAMATPSAEGAAAAATYFLQLYPFVNATGDLTEWDAMASPSCTFCEGVRDDVVERLALGHRNVGGVVVTSAKGTEVDPGRWYSARLQIVIAASTDVDESGATVDEHPEERHDIEVVMTWDGSWTVDEVGPAKSPET